MGIASVPYEEMDSASMSTTNNTGIRESQIYNFGVHRYTSQNNKSTKCVIQVDFEEESLSLLQRGQKLKSFPFRALRSVLGGDDSPRLKIQFDDLNEIDIDAGTLEEKNKISRLLLLIIGQIQTGSPLMGDDIVEKRKSPIKEGVLEKKGHSAAFLMWPKRFVRLFPGELIYFKVGDEKNESSALSIVSLLPDETYVRKLDENGFLLVTSQKEYAFRVSSNKSEEIEKERNDWILALQSAIRGRLTEASDSVTLSQQQKLQRGGSNATQNNAFHQEQYLKSIASSLNDELEQLGVMLNVIDAPIRASTQVKKVREIVQSLNDQISTGLLSWTLRHARNQRLSMTASDLGLGGDEGFDPTSLYINHQRGGDDSNMDYPTRGSAMILPTNQQELQQITQQMIDRDFANDSRYLPYPNYRRPSALDDLPSYDDSSAVHQSSPYEQYVPESRHSRAGVPSDDGYALVNKKRIKQKRTAPMHTYANIDRRDNDLNLWSDETPPLPPKDPELDDGEKEEEATSPDKDTATTTVTTNQTLTSFGDLPAQPIGDSQISNKAATRNSIYEAQSEIPAIVTPAAPPPPSGAVPAPPPLPGVNQVQLTPKKDFIPNCKMKPLFWSKVPDVLIKQTIWKDSSDKSDAIDIARIEELFHLAQPTDMADGLKKQTDTIKGSPKDDNKPRSLLDAKKAQNLGIFLSGFKLNVKDLESKLSTFDDENGLTSEEINALKRFQPTTEESEMFKAYKGEFGKLVDVDQFVYKMCEMKDLNSRLDVLLTIREIPDQIQGIEPAITNLIKACRSLKDNADFKHFLEYVLTVGNYLNGGTNRGRAHGFRLSALVKLVDIRSVDKKQTLLQFLAEELYQKDPQVLMCYKQMDALLIPMDISIKGLTAEVDIMSKDVEKLKKQISQFAARFDEAFIGKVNEFINTYSEKLLTLQQNCSEIVQLSVQLKRMYGESQSVDFEAWLNHVSDFVKQLQRASEAAEAKQRRLTSRQKQPLQKGDLEKVVGELAKKNTSAAVVNNGENEHQQKLKKHHKRSESYEKIISHHTTLQHHQSLTPASNSNTPSVKPVTFNVGNAMVLDLQPAESMEELSFPTKTGWLEKLSGGKKRIRKWDFRFFELTTTGYLHYSKSEDGKLSGAIYLRKSPVKVDPNDPCVMEIHHEQRVWKLRGDNELEVSDWLKALSYYSQMGSFVACEN